jgi:hypothetical protein
MDSCCISLQRSLPPLIGVACWNSPAGADSGVNDLDAPAALQRMFTVSVGDKTLDTDLSPSDVFNAAGDAI